MQRKTTFSIGLIAAGAAAVIGLSAPAANAAAPVRASAGHAAVSAGGGTASQYWVVYGGCYYWVDPQTGIWYGPYACVA